MKKRQCENCERRLPSKKVALYHDVKFYDGSRGDVRLCVEGWSCMRLRARRGIRKMQVKVLAAKDRVLIRLASRMIRHMWWLELESFALSGID